MEDWQWYLLPIITRLMNSTEAISVAHHSHLNPLPSRERVIGGILSLQGRGEQAVNDSGV